jgi:hypothetical protein
MIDHPCVGLSPPCREAFERLCVHLPHGATPFTLNTLLNCSLIIRTSGDADINYETETFDVPSWAHIRWCQWCDENIVEGPK